MVDALRLQLGIDYIDLTKTDIKPEMSQYIPKALACENRMVPVSVSKDMLFLAMADPTNFMAIEQAKMVSKKNIVPMIAAGNAVDHAISTLYGNEGDPARQLHHRACLHRERLRYPLGAVGEGYDHPHAYRRTTA